MSSPRDSMCLPVLTCLIFKGILAAVFATLAIVNGHPSACSDMLVNTDLTTEEVGLHRKQDVRPTSDVNSCEGYDRKLKYPVLPEKPSATAYPSAPTNMLYRMKDLYMQDSYGLGSEDAAEVSHPESLFEVSTPLDPPPNSPCASLRIFRHSFANTYNLPPAMSNYTPPSERLCGSPSRWSLVVLTWRGSSVGRQFDRIAAVWFGGVEFLRTCTAEPTSQGIVWEVKKDVTKYSSVLAKPQPLVVELGNLVNDKYTGVFDIDIQLDFFGRPQVGHLRPRDRHADVVLPLSSPSPLPSGHWFHISNDTYVARRNFSLPANAYRAVLEVYVSYHGNDEFWYTNPPNDYIRMNNLSDVPGNGPFREVQALLDERLVGTVWPFPVIYTGGVVNLYWRPAAAIGAFDLPTYEFDLSPFLGSLTGKQEHYIDFRVENAIGDWYVDGSLHLWLDENGAQTMGGLTSYSAPDYNISMDSDFKGLEGEFKLIAQRVLSYSGFVSYSAGNFSVSSSYSLQYHNSQGYRNKGALQSVSQLIDTTSEVKVESASEVVLLENSLYSFPLDLTCLSYGMNGSIILNCNLSHAFNKLILASGSSSSASLLKNSQQCQGEIVIVNSTVIRGYGALQQQYRTQERHICYLRDLSTRNNTILHDSSDHSCLIAPMQT
ncbi:hypothetical protein KP509_12G096500 [Ceratopteris richardii]|uniref:Peptide N-acetyl-beta-D-glucosaminyl asparaginase amidase A N-terminal domain-containing protein n=1 Tax=Ceratopteris richardii TaxID=49495 RepID=A0A8T2TP59_CERRI|nr:hypothetical protein KP509_12G096500 [Ceratopteris richardii]